MTPMREKFYQKRHDEQNAVIAFRNRLSDQVVLQIHGYEIKISNPSFFCPDHGIMMARCQQCHDENPRNWDPPQFNDIVVKWADATKALQRRCPTPGCTAYSAHTGRICSKLPHSSLLPEFSEDSVTDTFEGTAHTCNGPTLSACPACKLALERRFQTRRTEVLPELSFKGSLGTAPKEYQKRNLPERCSTSILSKL